MLQQTRVETVLPYYRRWMQRFPDVRTLARASREDVLRHWEGLGYYRRAHNLHRAAQIVEWEHSGRLPETSEALSRLPGIGRYTAAAIMAIAHGADVVALDGNLQRVLARFIDLQLDPRSPEGERRLLARAHELLPPGRAAEFNQALMDLGALVCRPRKPQCPECPLAQPCQSRRRGVERDRPVRKLPRRVPHYLVAAGVLREKHKVLIARRPENELLGGLWEFPGGTVKVGEALEACLLRELHEELGVKVDVGQQLGTFEHAYTHFRVTVHAFECRLGEGRPRPLEHSELRWVETGSLSEFPMGKVDRAISGILDSPVEVDTPVQNTGQPTRAMKGA